MDGMPHGNRPDPQPLTDHGFGNRNRVEGEYGIVPGGNRPEVGPHPVVEDVPVHRLDGFARSVYDDRPAPLADQQIGHQRDVLDVIEMAVREEDVVDPQDLVELQGRSDRARVHAQRAVDEETGGLVPGELSAVTAEDANLHVASFSNPRLRRATSVSSAPIFPRARAGASSITSDFGGRQFRPGTLAGGKSPTCRAVPVAALLRNGSRNRRSAVGCDRRHRPPHASGSPRGGPTEVRLTTCWLRSDTDLAVDNTRQFRAAPRRPPRRASPLAHGLAASGAPSFLLERR